MALSLDGKIFLFIVVALYYFGIRLIMFARRTVNKKEAISESWLIINLIITVMHLIVGVIDALSSRVNGNYSLIGAILIALGFFHTVLQVADLIAFWRTIRENRIAVLR